jgi:hypothetical protein
MWSQFKERTGEGIETRAAQPFYFIASIDFPTVFQEHYARWWKCIRTRANCFGGISTKTTHGLYKVQFTTSIKLLYVLATGKLS